MVELKRSMCGVVVVVVVAVVAPATTGARRALKQPQEKLPSFHHPDSYFTKPIAAITSLISCV